MRERGRLGGETERKERLGVEKERKERLGERMRERRDWVR